MPDLRPLLMPDSVAIIGAAADDSLRGRLTKQLIEHGYDGRVYPVTRSQKEVLGHKAYAAVGDIPEAADLDIDYRHKLFGNYRIIYRVEGNLVFVVRVIHGARLLLRSMFE